MDIDPVMNSPVCVLESLRAFRDDERTAISVALNAYCSSDSEEGPKIDLVVVTGLAGKPFCEYERVGEWLMSNEEILACQPPRFYVKFATEFRTDADSVALVPLSCASGSPHAGAVNELSKIVSVWCDAADPTRRIFGTTSDAIDTIGPGQGAPDVAVTPLPLAAANRYPRLIIEFEHNHRGIRQLRHLVHHYFSVDQEKCIRAVLAIKVTIDRASAVLYERNASNDVIVTGDFDFGRHPCNALQQAEWSAIDAAYDHAPPAPNPIHRYVADAQWPQEQDDPNWMPGPPIVTIPHGQITHNLDAAFAARLAPALVDLTIDLGLVLQVCARMAVRVQ
jgi:hypothetical protein